MSLSEIADLLLLPEDERAALTAGLNPAEALRLLERLLTHVDRAFLAGFDAVLAAVRPDRTIRLDAPADLIDRAVWRRVVFALAARGIRVQAELGPCPVLPPMTAKHTRFLPT